MNNFAILVTNNMLKAFIIMSKFVKYNYWSTFTEKESIDSLDLWKKILLSLILLNFSVFSLTFYIKEKTKIIYFLTLLFYTEPILDIFSLVLFNLVFFFLWQVFITLSWLFFYSFFVLFIILSSFFFRMFFFCFLQDFLPIKPAIIHFLYISLTNQ